MVQPKATTKTSAAADNAHAVIANKRKDKYLQISRAAFQQGLSLTKPPVNANYGQTSSNARCFIAYLAGVLKEKEPELSHQLSAILGSPEEKQV